MLGNMRRQKYLTHAKCSNPAGSSSVLPLRLRSIARSAVRRPMRVTVRSLGQPSRVSQARAHSGRYRKQEFVIFASTEGVAQRRRPPRWAARRRRSIAPRPLASPICRTPSARPSLRSMHARAARLRPSIKPKRVRGSGRRYRIDGRRSGVSPGVLARQHAQAQRGASERCR